MAPNRNTTPRMITPYSLPMGDTIINEDRKLGSISEEVTAQKRQNIYAGFGVGGVLLVLVWAFALLYWNSTDTVDLRGVGVFSVLAMLLGLGWMCFLFAVRGSKDEVAIWNDRREAAHRIATLEIRLEDTEAKLSTAETKARELSQELTIAFKDTHGKDAQWVAANNESTKAFDDAVTLMQQTVRGKGSRESMRGAPFAWGQSRWEAARQYLESAGVLWYEKGKPRYMTDEKAAVANLQGLKLNGVKAQAAQVGKLKADYDDDED